MQFVPPLQPAIFYRRYKRFLADVELPNGEVHTIHCPNTGSMKHCMVAQSPCWFSVSDNAKRKYPFTWEIATTMDGHLAGIHTGRANALVKEAIVDGIIIELQHYPLIKAEVRYGLENSRIDFLLSDGIRPDCYVEVKSVTLGMGKGLGLFPDSVSERGTKHLRELMAMVDQGHRAVLVFCVQHTGITTVSPADDIDPVYGETLRQAMAKGVEILVYGVDISPQAITVTTPLDLLL
jgi:sugar fermentation stimulation protein A